MKSVSGTDITTAAAAAASYSPNPVGAIKWQQAPAALQCINKTCCQLQRSRAGKESGAEQDRAAEYSRNVKQNGSLSSRHIGTHTHVALLGPEVCAYLGQLQLAQCTGM